MITLTDNLKKRIDRERIARHCPHLVLRIGVDSGGCAGFKYHFAWEDTPFSPLSDILLENVAVIDSVSLPFLEESTIDFIQNLMGEDFLVMNPRAVSGCGCGQSFAV